MDADKIRASFLEKFRQVVYERSNTLSEQFEQLLSGDDERVADALMRELHTLKGESRMMGFAAAGQIVHTLEDALKSMRKERFSRLPQLRDVFFEVLDTVAAIAGQDAKPDPEPICQRIKEAQQSSAQKDPTPPTPQEEPDPRSKRTPSTSSFELPSMVRISGQSLDHLSNSLSDLFSTYLQIKELGKSLGQIRKICQPYRSGSQKSVRQKDSLLADLQSLDREMATYQRNFRERSLAMATGLDQVLEEVRQIRLLPISTLFSVYSAAARDLARAAGKPVDIKLEGESTLVDRSILDALGDILLHLIRNAIDHGLETESDRQTQDKSPRGCIWLRAAMVNDRIRIELEDDGKGIDPSTIRRLALRKGVIGRREFESLTSQESLELIFAPGFSTAEKTTELSGRGVGMDVVRNRLQDLGGAIHVESSPGSGTLFAMELPTTVAIARVVMFKAAGQVFALLATFVRRVETIERTSLLETSGGTALTMPEGTITAAPAGELLRLGAFPGGLQRIPVLLLEHGDRRIALLVDELLGEQELTIKPFSAFLSKVRAISGAAVLEDGSLVLLLHAGELISLSSRSTGKQAYAASPNKQAQPHRVLLVEDSIITRELERSVLLSFGLLVEEAADGEEALAKLSAGEFDVVVSDVEMPRMNGFDLTRRIKAGSDTAHLPVILVTTLADDEDKRKGMEAGADGYIVKSEFGSQSFIDLVSSFLPDRPGEESHDSEAEFDEDNTP